MRYFFFLTVCSQLHRGIFTLLAPTAELTYDTLAAYTNTFHMPFVSPSLPSKSFDRPMLYGISMKPRYLRAILDVIKFYQWKSIIYLYDSDEGTYLNIIFFNFWLNVLPFLFKNPQTVIVMHL